MTGRKQRLYGTGVTFFGLLFIYWATSDLEGDASSARASSGLSSGAASRKLLADPGRVYDVYAPEQGGVRKCLLDSYCSSAQDCLDRCNDDQDCPGYSILETMPPQAILCKHILPPNSGAFVGWYPHFNTSSILYRKPGAPCIVGDSVMSGKLVGNVIMTDGSDMMISTLVGNISSNVKDTYRLSIVGKHVCDPDPSENRMYPNELFSEDQLKHGAIALHAFGVLYMFFGLAIVCDDYFVPALEVITVKLQLSDDVAGATFMAAGGSAPELFTSVIGVFIAESDVGFGTIIGSAVFNVLFVIGACALATREMAKDIGGLPLTWWPLARDSLFYLVDLVLLMVFFRDKKITWWESLILLLCYCSYVLFMSRNVHVYARIRAFLDARSGKVVPTDEAKTRRTTLQENKEAGQGIASEKTRARSNSTSKMLTRQTSGRSAEAPKEGDHTEDKPSTDDKNHVDNTPRKEASTGDDDDDDEGWGPSPPSEGVIKWLLLFPLNFPLWLSLPSGNTLGQEKELYEREQKLRVLSERLVDRGLVKKGDKGKYVLPSTEWLLDHAAQLCPADDEDLRGEDDLGKDGKEVLGDLISSFKEAHSTGHAQAAAFLDWASETDRSDAPYARELRASHGRFFGALFIGGFFGSILWIGGFTYLMVWWAETIGKTLGISEVVMGITVLAAGTSVPDLISSVIVARDGKADMAVSSSIGSNIFDATFGLPLPWFLWSLAHGGEAIEVKASALGSSVLMLVAMLLSVIASIAMLGWRLNVKLGGLSLFNYATFVTITILMTYDQIPTAF